jgi:hypothetical protein
MTVGNDTIHNVTLDNVKVEYMGQGRERSFVGLAETDMRHTCPNILAQVKPEKTLKGY